MTYSQIHINAYKAATYREENKTMQVIMLYEGALRYVQQAKAAIEAHDIELRYNSLAKACDILTGLQLSLNFNEGGEVAQLLYDYYAGLDMRLNHLQFNDDIKIYDLCIRHLSMMKEAWEDVHQSAEHSNHNSANDATTVIINKLKDLEGLSLTTSSSTADDNADPQSYQPSHTALLASINMNA